MSHDHVWIVGAAVFAGLTFVFYLLRDVIPATYRYFRLKRPCEIFFVITSYDRGKVDYVVQDEDEHFVRELIVPANRDVYVQIQLKTKTAFTQRYLAVEFVKKPSGGKVPVVDHYKLQFIKVGKDEKFPKTDEGHWVDHHDIYHITEERQRLAGQDIPYGFIVKTRDPGRYQMKVHVGVDNKGIELVLDFVVEDPHRTKMRCTRHFGCLISPDAPVRGNSRVGIADAPRFASHQEPPMLLASTAETGYSL